jgi:hypothetical protein
MWLIKNLRYSKKSMLNFKPVMCIWKFNVNKFPEKTKKIRLSVRFWILLLFTSWQLNGFSNTHYWFEIYHLFICWYLLVLSWIKCYIISKSVANHMQMWLGKKIVISHFGYWHFLSTANTENMLVKKNTNKEFSHFPQCRYHIDMVWPWMWETCQV